MNEDEAKDFIRERIYQAGLKESVDEGKEGEGEGDIQIDYDILGVPTPSSTPSTNIEKVLQIFL